MVVVKLMETYDLSTTVGKMGMIAIRTPSAPYIALKYPGFYRNFKFVRVVKGDVSIACASALPADPLQIGSSANQIAPQDMFNPLLYKAVSNESWNGLVNRIYGESATSTSLSDSVKFAEDMFPNATSENSTRAYYALLSDPSFKKAHPQAGLTMRGLRPLVWTLLHTFGFPLNGGTSPQLSPPTSDVPSVYSNGTSVGVGTGQGSYLRGHPQSMPRQATVMGVSESVNSTTGAVTLNPSIALLPRCYCAVIITPPSGGAQLLYYRLVVTWTVEFSAVRSDVELGLIGTAAEIGRYVHYDGVTASKLTDLSPDAQEVDDGRSVESDGLNLSLVMES